MAQTAVVHATRLDQGSILAPERYDPRRDAFQNYENTVGDVAEIVSDMIAPDAAERGTHYIVLNTGDARDGMLTLSPSAVVTDGDIGSAKKVAEPGDVIISRLRPYLRQVAYVDSAFGAFTTLVSTEFYVLRRADSSSIAFLVPFLLSSRVQEALAAAQEGGHHPRFNRRTLEAIGIPPKVMAERELVSEEVEEVVEATRSAAQRMRELIAEFSELS